MGVFFFKVFGVDSSSNLGNLLMAGICCGVVREGETSVSIEPSSRTLKRRKVELLTYKFIADVAVPPAVPPAVECSRKRQKLELYASTAASSTSECCKNGVQSSEAKSKDESEGLHACETLRSSRPVNLCENSASTELVENEILRLENPRFGVTSVCGRRRDMEDAVSVHPSFSQEEGSVSKGCHFFGVFDGHGCSHVSIHDPRFGFFNFFFYFFRPIILTSVSIFDFF